VAERRYSTIADDQAFSLGVFQALPWVALGSNTQYIAAGRGRMVACDAYCVTFSGGGVLGRYVFDATPLETNYRFSPLISFGDWNGGVIDVEVTVDSEDELGGNAAQTVRTYSVRSDNYPRRTEKILEWPFEGAHQFSTSPPVALPWTDHKVNAALPTLHRVITVSVSASASWNPASIQVVYRGCSIVGYRE